MPQIWWRICCKLNPPSILPNCFAFANPTLASPPLFYLEGTDRKITGNISSNPLSLGWLPFKVAVPPAEALLSPWASMYLPLEPKRRENPPY